MTPIISQRYPRRPGENRAAGCGSVSKHGAVIVTAADPPVSCTHDDAQSPGEPGGDCVRAFGRVSGVSCTAAVQVTERQGDMRMIAGALDKTPLSPSLELHNLTNRTSADRMTRTWVDLLPSSERVLTEGRRAAYIANDVLHST